MRKPERSPQFSTGETREREETNKRGSKLFFRAMLGLLLSGMVGEAGVAYKLMGDQPEKKIDTDSESGGYKTLIHDSTLRKILHSAETEVNKMPPLACQKLAEVADENLNSEIKSEEDLFNFMIDWATQNYTEKYESNIVHEFSGKELEDSEKLHPIFAGSDIVFDNRKDKKAVRLVRSVQGKVQYILSIGNNEESKFTIFLISNTMDFNDLFFNYSFQVSTYRELEQFLTVLKAIFKDIESGISYNMPDDLDNLKKRFPQPAGLFREKYRQQPEGL